MNPKLKAALPFLVVVLIVLYSWIEIMVTEYVATWQHYVALALVAVNAALYFVRYKQAVLFTGLILILATFNLLSFFTTTWTFGITLFGLSSPEIQPWSLLLLIVFGVINFHLLIEWYWDLRDARDKRV